MTAFDWKKYLNIAEKNLLENSEECNRSGISRAYYASFGKARVMCSNHRLISASDLSDTSGKIHRTIIENLKISDYEELAVIGNKLETLRQSRNKADYDSFCLESGKQKSLAAAINTSKEIIQLISEYQP